MEEDEPRESRLRLSPRERDVLQLLAEGLDVRSIAAALGISQATVRTHMRGARARLGARSRPHAVALALARGEIVAVRGGVVERSAVLRR